MGKAYRYLAGRLARVVEDDAHPKSESIGCLSWTKRKYRRRE